MNTHQVLDGHTIAGYLSRSLPREKKIQALRVTADIRWAIINKLPIAISYHGVNRLIIPASLYLQEKTWSYSRKIADIQRWYPSMKTIDSPWARRAIGFDGLEILGKRGQEELWKSYHIDRIENIRLITLEELDRIFPWLNDDRYMKTPTEPPEGHVKNWNYWSRTYIAERDDSTMNLK